jgi:hypothetical protein
MAASSSSVNSVNCYLLHIKAFKHLKPYKKDYNFTYAVGPSGIQSIDQSVQYAVSRYRPMQPRKPQFFPVSELFS